MQVQIRFLPTLRAGYIHSRGLQAAARRQATWELRVHIERLESVLPQVEAAANAGHADAEQDAMNIRAHLIELQERLHAAR